MTPTEEQVLELTVKFVAAVQVCIAHGEPSVTDYEERPLWAQEHEAAGSLLHREWDRVRLRLWEAQKRLHQERLKS